MGKTRFFFAGSNSGKGFFSLFDNIIGPEARRVYLLKGGPGTGKSSFMSYIANAAAHKG
nr:ATP-binding protein [Bacillota bacterium]